MQLGGLFAVKITTLQQHETLMGMQRDLPRWPRLGGEGGLPYPSGHVAGEAGIASALPLCL